MNANAGNMDRPARRSLAGEGGKPPRLRKFGCMKIFLCGLGLVLLAIGYWYTKLYFARQDFLRHAEALVAEIEAERPRVPDEENAAPLYLEAFKLYVEPKDCGASMEDGFILDGQERLRVFGERLPQVTDVAPDVVARYLQANQLHAEALRRAVEHPRCDFGVSLRSTNLALPRHCWKMKRTTRFLAMAAGVKARDGHPGEAVDFTSMGLRLSRDIGHSGTPGTRALQAQCELTVVGGLGQVLNASSTGETHVLELLSVLNRHLSKRSGMEPCLRTGKAAFLLSFYGPLVSGRKPVTFPTYKSSIEYELAGQWEEEPATTGRLVFAAWQHSGFVLGDARNYEASMQLRVEASAQPLPQALDAIALLSQNEHTGWRTLISEWAVGSVDRLMVVDALSLARLRSAQLALGCRLYKLKFGAYPEKLSELSEKFPEHFKTLPTDPFSGKDLLYKRTEAGCKVWSVGKNRLDDGGLPRPSRDPKKPNDYDEVFELTR